MIIAKSMEMMMTAVTHGDDQDAAPTPLQCFVNANAWWGETIIIKEQRHF